MQVNRDTCIFTGAGFSCAIFNQKTQNEFIHDFLNSNDSKEYIKYLSDEIKRFLLTINDIELAMSHYSNLGYSKLYQYNGRQREYMRTIVLLRTAISLYLRSKFLGSFKCYDACYKELLRIYFEKNNLTNKNFFVVTTNYDLSFEKIIDDIFGKDQYYYPGKEFSNNDDASNKIPIFKLHGSVNWMENRGLYSDNWFIRPNPNLQIDVSMLEKLEARPLKERGELSLYHSDGNKYTPIIITFFFQKEYWLERNNEQWENLFNNSWGKARDFMINSKKFIFWGYGLPSADHYIFTFLYSIFENTAGKCCVVDLKSETSLVKMLKQLYADRGKDFELCTDGIVNYLKK